MNKQGSKASTVAYELDGATFASSMLARGVTSDTHMLMLLAPNFTGVNERALQRGEQFVTPDRDVFIIDIYGTAGQPRDLPGAFAAMSALDEDPAEVRRRMSQALSIALEKFEVFHGKAPDRVSAIGFCFGGGNVLELARAGAELDAIVSIHGSLATRLPAARGAIRTPILIAHGSADPVVPKSHRDAVELELAEAEAEWDMLLFGGVLHGYTEEHMEPSEASAYNEAATLATYRAVDSFTWNSAARKAKTPRPIIGA